jgi:hypothetical protein
MPSPYQILSTINRKVDDMDDQLLEERMDKILVKKQAKNRWKNVKAAYYHPKENKIYFGEYEDEEGRIMPSWEQAVYDLNKKRAYEIKAKQGSLNRIEAMAFDPWEKEFRPDAQVFAEYMEKMGDKKMSWKQIITESAGAMVASDFQGLRLVSILGQLVNQQQKKYVLQDAFPTVPTTELMLRIPTVSRFEIAEGLDEFDLVESMKMAFTAQYIQLKKDVAHLAWSDEFMMASFDQPIYALHLQNAQSEFERVKAAKVARQLLLLTPLTGANAGADLLAFESGTEHSDYNPILGFASARVSIDAGNGVMTRAAMNTYTYQAYTLNSYIGNSALSPTATSEQINRRIVNLPKAPDLTAYLDEVMPNGKIALWDETAGVRVQSIIRSSTYRDEHPGGNGLYIRDWNGAFFLRPTQGVLLTNLVV